MKKYLNVFITIVICISCSKIQDQAKNPSFPILILNSDGSFGEYTGEILKTQGFNLFHIADLKDVITKPDYLSGFDIVILTEGEVQDKIVKILSTYIKNGGSLIAFRPDEKLCHLFGISYLNRTVSDGYLEINPSTKLTRGLISKTLQFHDTAYIYNLKGATKIADLYIDANKPIGAPAVMLYNYGAGHSVSFSYDLPKSILYTRQGNPEFAAIEKDGIHGIRGMDLFADGWINSSKNTLNQADEQMLLLARCIEQLSVGKKPLPKLWYFPDTLKCLAILDNDGEDNYEADFEPQFRDIDSMGAQMTIYIKDVEKVSKAWVEKWTKKGFEIAAHPDNTVEAHNPTWHRMDSILADIKEQIASAYDLKVKTNVNHWFVWVARNEDGTRNFAAQARLEEKHGIEMDANYAHYDINSSQGAYFLGPLGVNQGNYTGSGMIMKYGEPDGKVINVYQRFNSVYDQHYMESRDPEGFFNCFKGLVDRSVNDDIFSYISVKAHNNEYSFSKEPILRMLQYANEKGIPVWTALNLLNFVKMKNEASFADIIWKGNKLSFTLKSALKHKNGLTFMIPAVFRGQRVKSISIDGKENKVVIKSMRQVEYAFVTVVPGSDYDVQVTYEK